MRKQLGRVLSALAAENRNLFLVTADLGTFRTFRGQFPDRFINVGVAEQNSVGIAAGLASEGKQVFLYSVAGFTVDRAFEQIKFCIGYWNKPVCIIGTGFGWRYHRIGRGHHAPDDIALMRLVPNMRILAPIDEGHLMDLLTPNLSGPCYLRLGEGGLEGKLQDLPRIGSDGVVVALGEVCKRCAEPVRQLRILGFDVGLMGVEEVSLASVNSLLAALPHACHIVVVEEHVALGGLADVVRESGFKVHKHIHLPLIVETISEDEQTLLRCYGFDTESLKRYIAQGMGLHGTCGFPEGEGL